MELSEIIAVLSLGVSLTSLAVSFLIAKFYGERWVEMARRRREHSSDLELFDVVKDHSESKYPCILKAWEDL